MRLNILLDECVDRRLRRHLTGHNVKTVQECGWSGLENGELVAKIGIQFELFITFDKNMLHQQNIAKYPMAFMVVTRPSQNPDDLKPMAEKIILALPSIKNGTCIQVD